ncbi:hypothetical protein [Rheinheimera sp. 4Y26]|uniref:hypothetical protein n=1 Tax=Rheinheimera sp. 4Y26 TaxID=2977811 RepID=UPI0021B09911|nr:hypothetical protein [Rheinheimera sp. 4Y26]MCT6698066.1 hypothetical protein [Rheinheimera sp. 4Y26]
MKWVLLGLLLLQWPPSLTAEPMVLVDAVALLPKNTVPVTTEGKVLAHILSLYPSAYSTENISRNRARAWVKTAKNACIPWLKKTKARQQDFLFSLPYMLEEPLQLVLLQNSQALPKLQNLPQPVPLQQLLSAGNLLLGIEQNRSYGEALDKLLQQHQHNRALYLRTSSSEDQSSMMPMLQRRFVDALIEYPEIANRSGLPLRFFSLAEAEPVNLVYFACSKGEQGQRVVNTLNQIILQLSQQHAYRDLVLQHLPEAQRQQGAQIWQAALSEPAKTDTK